MAHSNRKLIHWGLLAGESALFLIAVGTAYLSQVNNWSGFFIASTVSFALFLILKLVDAYPMLKEFAVREDIAGRIASTAFPRGLSDYYDMQRKSDQDRRNVATQADIASATNMWLCANSGASYLDPAIYRHWSAVERRLKEGIEFRVVLLDPFSAEKGFRNNLNVGGEQFDSKMNLPSLIKLYNTFPSLDVRFVRYGMHATVFATDNALFVDPYHVGVVEDRIENRSYCLRIEPRNSPDGVGLYRLFKSHLDTLWRAGTSFEEWIEKSKEMLPKGLPDLKRRQYTV